jgi:hypothetical protein
MWPGEPTPGVGAPERIHAARQAHGSTDTATLAFLGDAETT